MSRPAVVIALAAVTFATAPAAAQEAAGYLEVRGSAHVGVDGEAWQLVERLRPRFEAPLAQRVRLGVEIELAFAQGRNSTDSFRQVLENSDFGPFLELADCVWPTHRNELLRIDGADGYLDVDRLYLDVYLPWMDLRVGRQALHWGSSPFINPTDPFPEVLFTEPWRPRRGVNAVRAIVPVGPSGDLTAALAANDSFTALRAAGRARLNAFGTDFAVSAAWADDRRGAGDGLLGLDIRGTLGVGFWLEASVHLGQDRVYEELAVGIDYSFNVLDGLFVAAQYYRNGAGIPDPDDRAAGAVLSGSMDIDAPDCSNEEVAAALSGRFGAESLAADPFAPVFSARDYLLLSLSWRLIPELSFSFAGLQNLNDGTAFVVPTLTVVPLGWLEISVTAQVPFSTWGEGGEFKPRAKDLILSQNLPAPGGTLSADFSGLAPDAVITAWVRAGF